MGTSSPSEVAQLELFGAPPRPFPPSQRRPPAPAGEYLTSTDLRQRGWTATAARRFLGEPDEVVEKRRGGWRIRENRYSAARVLEVEGGEAFAAWAIQRDRRRRAAEAGVQRALAELSAWSPSMPRLTLQEVRQLAVDSYNERLRRRQERSGDWTGRPAGVESDLAFLDRISVNYLRHAATRYDEMLARLDRMGLRGAWDGVHPPPPGTEGGRHRLPGSGGGVRAAVPEERRAR